MTNDKSKTENGKSFLFPTPLLPYSAKLKFIDAQPLDAQVERRRRKAQRSSGAILSRDAPARRAQRGLDRLAFLGAQPFVHGFRQIPRQIAVREGVPIEAERAVARKND